MRVPRGRPSRSSSDRLFAGKARLRPREQEALGLSQARPGITIAELGDELGVEHRRSGLGLRRVLPEALFHFAQLTASEQGERSHGDAATALTLITCLTRARNRGVSLLRRHGGGQVALRHLLRARLRPLTLRNMY
jgi:hypothetical protein